MAFKATAVHKAPASPTEVCAHRPPKTAPSSSSAGAAILLFLSTFDTPNNLASENKSQ